jgi:hypothetical protein
MLGVVADFGEWRERRDGRKRGRSSHRDNKGRKQNKKMRRRGQSWLPK